MTNKDWKGNHPNSVWKTLGASNHTLETRHPEEFYATQSIAIDILCNEEKFDGDIWEISSGRGDLSNRLIQLGYNVYSTDIIDRGGCEQFIGEYDFLQWEGEPLAPNIITNPPYSLSTQFIYKAMELLPTGGKLALFLKLQFLEGKARKILFQKYPMKTLYVSSSRILCAKNGEFEKMKAGGGSAVAYGWYVWVKGFQGDPIIKWVN